MRPAFAVLLVVFALGLAACGTTVRDGRGSDTATGLAGSAVRSAPAAAVPDTIGTSPGPASVAAPAASSNSTPASAALPPEAPAAARGLAVIPSSSPGVTGTQIKIGFNINAPGSATNVAGEFGVKGVSSVPDKPRIDALVKYVNAHGGIAGRTVVPVYQYTDITSGSFDVQAQATCSYFTQDNKVAALVQFVDLGSSVLPMCMAQHGVLFFDVGNDEFYDHQQIASQFGPTYFSLHRPTLDRFGFVIRGLADHGYFDAGARVGVLIYDTPAQQRTVTQVIKPALAAVGQKLVDTFAFGVPGSAAAISGTAQQAQSAVLRFRTEGIDHVLLLDSQAAIPFLFMPEADSEGYHPRYGLSSGDVPSVLEANESASQLGRSLVIGWSRALDLGANQTFSDGTEIRTCVSAVSASGYTNPIVGYGIVCDPLFFVQRVLTEASAVSVPAFRAAADGLGSAFQLADAPATHFGPGVVDGVAAYRVLPYATSCKCFQYAGPPSPTG